MKRQYLNVFAIAVCLGLLGVLFFRFASSGDTTPVNPTNSIVPSISQKTMLTAISKELRIKYNRPLDDFIIALDREVDNYAKGSIKFKGEGGGGLWFAAKINDKWELVYDGNGIVACSDLKQYPSFPSILIPQCFDEDQNTLIKR